MKRTSKLSKRKQQATGRSSISRAEELTAAHAAILSQLAEGVIVTDPVGRITFVNDAAARIHGVAMLNVEPDEYSDTYRLLTEDGLPYPTQELPLTKAVRGETVLDARWRIRRPDGTEVFAVGSAQPLREQSGAQVGAVLTLRDDTERSRAEAALRASEEFTRRILASSADCIKVLDLGARLEFMSEGSMCVMEVNDFGDIAGKCWPDFWENDEHLQALQAVEEAKRGGTGRFQGFARTMKGSPRWWDVIVTAISGIDGHPERLLAISRDVTATKLAEEAVRELNSTLEQRIAQRTSERDQLANILETTDVMVMAADCGFNILALNNANADEFERVYGVRPKVGDNMLALLNDRPDDREQVRAGWARGLAGEEITFVEDFGDATRDRPYYEIKFRPLKNSAGERIGAYQFVSDVTERVKAQAELLQTQEALRQAQKMEAIGHLTGGIAHDFNNLLASIIGSLQLIERRIADGRTNDLERYIDAAQGSAKRAAALTQRLLAFSRQQTLDPKPIDINKLVAGMEDLIRRSIGPGLELEVVGAGGLWATMVDPSQLENALLNLCINARDAMAEAGRITIETANKWLDERAARERDVPPGQYISLCVTDTGSGMTPDVIKKAFDPFFTTKPMGHGTGLGLSMIHGFVRQSGGQVRIYSELGTGTTMCIYLPRFTGAIENVQADADAVPDADGHGETILIIDDEPTVRMLMVDVLEEAGFRTLEAADGPAGLKILNTDVRVDLLITDVGLPGGMNGKQVADAARLTRPELKVLFVTGFAENAAVGNGFLEAGMQVLTKPFAITDLGLKARDMIEQPNISALLR